MNAAQAKAIPLEDVLERQGFRPVETRKGGRELWYLSPFRDERTPSFAIDTSENIWNDFAESGKGSQQCAGGKVIDYMIRYHNTDATGALRAVNDLFGEIPPEIKAKPSRSFKTEKTNPLKLLSAKAVFSPALYQYLESRKIDRELGRKYFKQVQYEHEDKGSTGFALGFANRKEGYEIRNKFFKGLIGKRGISVIQGEQSGYNVQLVEGCFDFLSLLTIYGITRPKSDVIVLNGAAMIGEAINEIERMNYRHAQTWFDNDTGGNEANTRLKKAFENSTLQIKQQNHKYEGFKDVNEMHMNLGINEIHQRFGIE